MKESILGVGSGIVKDLVNVLGRSENGLGVQG
jgi:hypothetical protein